MQYQHPPESSTDYMLYSSSDMYKMWQKVGKQRNPDEWEMTPATVNAYYNPPANEVSEWVRLRR